MGFFWWGIGDMTGGSLEAENGNSAPNSGKSVTKNCGSALNMANLLNVSQIEVGNG